MLRADRYLGRDLDQWWGSANERIVELMTWSVAICLISVTVVGGWTFGLFMLMVGLIATRYVSLSSAI